MTGRRQRSDTVTMPPPTGGWSTRRPYADMKPDSAIRLKNMLPLTSDVASRGGCEAWATGLGAAVESVFVYSKADGTQTLFGAAGGNIFDCTATGAVGSAKVAGLTSNRWQTVNFSTSAGPFLVAVNGTDKLRLFDGTAWKAIDGTSTPAITGIATTSLSNVNIYAQRVWFAEKNSLKIWYLPVGAISGAATSVDLGNAFRLGGFIQAIGTVTLDAGAGSDDHLAAITSNGEVAVYHGTDPSSASTWARIGVYRIGAPMGPNCFANYGGDLLVLSLEGIGPLSALVLSSQINSKSNYLTDSIQSAISEATTRAQSNYGWGMQICPDHNLLLVNIPLSGASEQYAMNTITGAWSRLTGWSAGCWCLFGNSPFFGSADGKTYKAFSGSTDSGNPIAIEWIGAFDSFGNSSQIKQFLMAKISLYIECVRTRHALRIGVETDYFIRDLLYDHIFPDANVGLSKFGTATVGAAIFGGIEFFSSDWLSIAGYGYAAALHVTGNLTESVRFKSYDLVYQRGGTL